MITEAGTSLALYSDNVNVYPGVIALFQLTAGSGGGPTTTVMSTTSVPMTMSTRVSTSTASMPGTTGWTFLGCYSDNVNGRTLVNGFQVPGGASAMTVELCEATCKSAGYILAGVEYSGECCKCPTPSFYSGARLLITPGCDNELENGGGPAPDGNAQCTMTCSGAPTETCGGPNRLDLYSYASTTVASTATTTSVSATATATGWNFRGCYTDSVAARTLGHPYPANPMTVEKCLASCQAAGYILAGVEYAQECCKLASKLFTLHGLTSQTATTLS